jgi:hypothetical protein
VRTTLNIAEDVLEAAEELAERQNKTPGQVISELVRRGVLCTNMHSDQKPLPRIDRLVTQTDSRGDRGGGSAARERVEMRTTLDIDDDILQAAKELARAEKKTAGQVLSELARKGLTQPRMDSRISDVRIVDGIPVIPARGSVVTKELIDRVIEEEDLEAIKLATGKT